MLPLTFKIHLDIPENSCYNNTMKKNNIHKTSTPETGLRRLINALFSSKLEFRVRLFNVLATGGTLTGILMIALSIVNYSGIMLVLINAACALLSFFLLIYSYRTGKYQICYMVTIIAIFCVMFPFLFFSSGGYHSGMLAFFIFAVVFTIFMLEGKKAAFFAVFEILLYTALCVAAYLRPDWVNFYTTEQDILIDVIISLITVSSVLGVCLYIHFRMYNAQQKKLNEQNILLEQTNLSKTEFLANASHEMRTPLTVISLNVQTVKYILEDMGVTEQDPKTAKMLVRAQSEIMRLSRMVGGMLTLASMSENTDKHKLDLTSLLQGGIEMYRLNLEKHGNTIDTAIEQELFVYGNADLLSQVFSNLLHNAATYTKNGKVTVAAERQGNEIIVTVKDTGTGISPELLPRVFERGVTTGGTGFGLYLCKTVVESHGGRIWIESPIEQGHGTAAMYVLPFYEGQNGDNED
jgi:signal transduction histidine kinase